MLPTVRVALLIDLAEGARYHRATVEAIHHAAGGLGRVADVRITPTDSGSLGEELGAADGVVIGPGSPYRDEAAVWDAIRSARERGLPLVGT